MIWLTLDTSTSVPSEVDAVEIARLWGEKYFLKNYDRLVRAKTVIDPNNVFSNEQGIPPILSPTSFTAGENIVSSS
jgi:hypothetical protein